MRTATVIIISIIASSLFFSSFFLSPSLLYDCATAAYRTSLGFEGAQRYRSDCKLSLLQKQRELRGVMENFPLERL
jgi:hypothetical protein